jgi:hypothetical protein
LGEQNKGMADTDKITELLGSDLTVINVGLEDFATNLHEMGLDVTHVDWSPPAGGNAKLADLLSKLGS